MPKTSTSPLRLVDFPHFIEDNPDFSFGSLAFKPGDDVLCMLCISYTNMNTYRPLFNDLRNMVRFQGARLWVQAFDIVLRDGISENLKVFPFTHPSADLGDCLTHMGDKTPLPNGNMPKHLVFAFNGYGTLTPRSLTWHYREPPSSPIWGGQKIPTTLVMPLSTFNVDVHAVWEQRSDVDILDPHVLPRFKAAIEGLEVREMRRLCEVSTRGPRAFPEPRKRL